MKTATEMVEGKRNQCIHTELECCSEAILKTRTGEHRTKIRAQHSKKVIQMIRVSMHKY